MKYNKIQITDRQRIIAAHEDEKDWKVLARTLGINLRTAYHWLENKQETPKKRGRATSKKTEEAVELLVKCVEDDPAITLAQLQIKLTTEIDLNVSLNTIKNWLDCKLFSLKDLRPCIQNINREENKKKRSAYIEKLFRARSEGRTIVWIDETNFNLYCRRREGRSRIGSRASIVLPASKGANLHCIGAMTSTTVVLFTTHRGAFKSPDCLSWMQELIDQCCILGIHHPTFVIDNAPVHSRLEELLEENPHIEIIRLAPYSYLLNPIELLWSVFKSHVKKMLREQMGTLSAIQPGGEQSMSEQRMRALEEMARIAISKILPTMLNGFVNRVEMYYSVSAREEDLVEIP